jgi:Dockerin type I domain
MKSITSQLIFFTLAVVLSGQPLRAQSIDTAPPIVVCINGISVNTNVEGIATILVQDLLIFANDNISPSELLLTGIKRADTGTGFPYAAGSTTEGQQSVVVDTTDIPAGQTAGLVNVEVWAMDTSGNAAFCATFVIVRNPTGSLITFCVEVSTLAGLPIDGSELVIGGVGSTISSNPDSITYCQTINGVAIGANTSLILTNTQDPINGVTAYDLLLLSRHILGIAPLDSPYKMIAADANKSNTITTLDIATLQKLILGLYSELPNNNSWRFVDKSQQFANPQNPFAETIREDITIAQIQASQDGAGFWGIKTGDLNYSATGIPNVYEALTDTIALEASVAGQTCLIDVIAGQEVVVDFIFPQPPLAWQYTLAFDGLEVLSIEPTDGLPTDGRFAIWPDAITTVGFQSDGAYSVRFRALESGDLEDMLQLTNQITRTIGYSDGPVPRHIKLDFCTEVATDSPESTDFTVWQNAPNPWSEVTTINFNVQKNDRVTLNVYDVTGRLVHTQAGDFAGGRNAFVLRKEQLSGASGVLYYTVASSTGTVTRSMIVR